MHAVSVSFESSGCCANASLVGPCRGLLVLFPVAEGGGDSAGGPIVWGYGSWGVCKKVRVPDCAPIQFQVADFGVLAGVFAWVVPIAQEQTYAV